jgi:N(2)-fixation sustaining protein CowN
LLIRSRDAMAVCGRMRGLTASVGWPTDGLCYPPVKNFRKCCLENKMTDNCGCKTDRYATFLGLDCDGRAHVVMDCIDRHLAIPGRNNRFWDYFAKKRAGGSGPKPDDLFLIHSNIHQIRDLFETWEDEESLKLLDELEEKCC